MSAIMQNKYSLKLFFLLMLGISVIFISCNSDAPHIKLVKTDFTLKLPYSQEASPFEKVKCLKMDSQGNFYILDSEKLVIFKFDASGNFINMFGGEGSQCGKLALPSAMDVYKDSLLLVHNKGSIDLLDLDGNCIRYIFVHGFTDMSISPNRTIVLNLMNFALESGFFIETYDLNGKRLHSFSPARGEKYQNRAADVAFTGFTSDNQLVYVPAFLDSIFIYDLEGNIVKRARRAIDESFMPGPAKPLEYMVEDVCVDNDRIFVLRNDKKASSDSAIYVKEIAEYNLDLSLVKKYELPEALTMSVATITPAPWYHKFIVRKNVFMFMASKPVEHLVAFAPED